VHNLFGMCAIRSLFSISGARGATGIATLGGLPPSCSRMPLPLELETRGYQSSGLRSCNASGLISSSAWPPVPLASRHPLTCPGSPLGHESLWFYLRQEGLPWASQLQVLRSLVILQEVFTSRSVRGDLSHPSQISSQNRLLKPNVMRLCITVLAQAPGPPQ
jgi:hypothetical protein